MAAKSQEVSVRAGVEGGGPVRESTAPQHGLLGEAVELHTLLQSIASVDDEVRVGRTESRQTGWQTVILALRGVK